MIEFDSGKATAIFVTFHATPKSPLHIWLRLSATSVADAWTRRNIRVSICFWDLQSSSFAAAEAAASPPSAGDVSDSAADDAANRLDARRIMAIVRDVMASPLEDEELANEEIDEE